MLKIAVTGGIGSGKSFILQQISRYKSKVISADAEINDIYHMESVMKKIAIELDILTPTKEKVKELVLQKRNMLLRLEKILYKQLNKNFRAFERKARLQKFKVCFFEIPLLFEKNLSHKYDAIINVEVPPFLQRRRFLLRNGNLKGFNYLKNLQFSLIKRRALCASQKGISFLNVKSRRELKNHLVVKLTKTVSACNY